MPKNELSKGFLPKARTTEIVVQGLDAEVLVYDLQNHKAHQLNETMSIIWRSCDGNRSIPALLELLEDHTAQKLDLDLVEFALNELSEKNLLTAPREDSFSKISRRDIAFKYAPIAIALPLVFSLKAPAAVQAQSCVQPNQPCIETTDCCTATLCFDPTGNDNPPICFENLPG